MDVIVGRISPWSASTLLWLGRRRSLGLRHRRRVPFACQRVGFWRIQPHTQIERTFRRRKPVGVLAFVRALMLKIEIERAIGVLFKRHPTAYGKSVERIGNLEAFGVIERD